MTTMAEIFAPIIPAIIVGGLILGFRNILGNVPLEFLGQKFVHGQAQFNPDGLYSITQLSMFPSFGVGLMTSYGYRVKLFSISYR